MIYLLNGDTNNVVTQASSLLSCAASQISHNAQPVIPPPAAQKKGTRNRFSKQEDTKLLKLVEKYGECWKEISHEFGHTRSPRQLRERYTNYIREPVKRTPFTESEDRLIIEKFKKLGPNWSMIASFIPGRSNINVKNRFAALNSNREKYRNYSAGSIDNDNENESVNNTTHKNYLYANYENNNKKNFLNAKEIIQNEYISNENPNFGPLHLVQNNGMLGNIENRMKPFESVISQYSNNCHHEEVSPPPSMEGEKDVMQLLSIQYLLNR
ncbi:Myb-like DNA-binding domain containing protein [Tritrichomonas foetus]|uniref:Myb-like DNA-binding domain containing protein n=1 Tax=Tritrichomonas foetus TaxID=1144522 RepID=A0A1J4KVS2_9EUKA|nr:Myb-like DNA-binding domain containing protein [Tritrichomonas foetus]|eukprot:OHT15327.1 Myb-like DNA-binding domain containing protein [Tritrichomonas foetus]